MDKEERYAKAPLLYIHQAKTGEINATMQHHYRTPKVKQETKQDPPSGSEHAEEIGKVESPGDEKRFQDMTIDEQVMYLLNRPAFAPQLVCEIKTEEKVYRGMILQEEDGVVTIQVGRRTVNVSKENIERVRLLSL